MAAVEMEELTSGASGRIIPVFKNLRRSVFSYDSFRRSLIFIQSIFLWFLLLLPRQRLSSASQPPSPSSSWPSLKRRFAIRREEEDTLRRRALAEGLQMVAETDDWPSRCQWSTSIFFGVKRNALFCRSWFPAVNCLRLLKSFSPKNFEPKTTGLGDDDPDTEQPVKLGKRGQITDQLVELPIEHQIYDMVDAAGAKGITITEANYIIILVYISIVTLGIMVIIHGLNEHSGRYAHFARQLTSCNFGVYAMDWIGHGGSDGLHGYVPSLDHVVADTGAFLEKIKSEYPGIPCFLFGHSTGGAVVLKAASYPHIEQMLEGIILTSPALRVKPAHPIVGAVAPLFSMVVPKYQFKGANKRGIPVSRDPAALLAKYSDPLVYTGPMRVRTGHEILRISSYLLRNFKSVTIPFFVLHGTADKVTDPLASQDLYNRAASEFKDIKLYEGFLHDLLFEPEHDEVAQDIIDWMEKRLLTSCNLENINSQW
ncbi:hypothetical protein TEA_010636 [Camellia sinensis var. sinensis]|uniref:Uncharacterized protein n=1 Tax=Camellia sinensis var. sinensis TaxID=542762 RepID=A0A4S4DC39_CAMSN|nr:hypothetical protein TEA_010636 [Camellia sinensis var. sinensis]